MDDLKIEGTEDSPAILLSIERKEVLITGRSLPEDAFTFYAPVMEWLDNYINKGLSGSVFIFNLEYFNTASAKQLYKIAELAAKLSKTTAVTVKWHYDEDDLDMLASGERFSRLTKLPFEYIQN